MGREGVDNKLADMIVRFYQSDRRWVWIKRVGVAVSFTFFFFAFVWSFVNANGRMPIFGEYAAVVSIKGTILDGSSASAEKLIPALRNAFHDESAKAVILQIDSPGGSPFEAERVYSEINRLRKLYPKPVIAVINTTGASAAYLIAIHADRIVGGQYSMIGSIGMIMEAYNAKGLADKMSVSKYTFASGPYKALLDPLGTPKEDELQVAQALVNGGAKMFADEVRARRGKRLKAPDFDSGAVWMGRDALALGLIDELGTLEGVAGALKLDTALVGPAPGLMASSGVADAIGASMARHVRAMLQMEPVLR